MSRRQFNGNLGRGTAELDLDVSRLSGSGNAIYPHLFWQLQMSLAPQKKTPNDYVLRSIAAQLNLPSGQKISEARPIAPNRVFHGYQDYWGEEYLNFEFPLDAQRIEAIESHRQGGSFQLRLDVRILADEYTVLSQQPEINRPAVWGLANIITLTLQETIEIPQSHWIERVLPYIGYGKVHIFELPAAPIEACAALDHSFRALKQAEEKHRLGFYDDAAGKCRIALDPFFDYEAVDPGYKDSRKIPVLKKQWETGVGKASYEWLKLTLGAIKSATNGPHHSPNEHYSQMDSQMLLAITTAVVAYVARTIKPEDLK